MCWMPWPTLRRTRRSIRGRVYLVGVSGGGHMAYCLLRWPAARPTGGPQSRPGCRSRDLAAWHAECRAAGRPYADDLERSVRRRARRQPGRRCAISRPLAPHLSSSRHPHASRHQRRHPRRPHRGACRSATRCGRSTPWPRRKIGSAMRTSPTLSSRPPCRPDLQGEWLDPLYGDKRVLFRRASGNARVTIFDGGHEIIYEAALSWLAGTRET